MQIPVGNVAIPVGVGHEMRVVRTALNLQQTELARAVGCSNTTISKIEKGARSTCSTLFAKILRELNTDLVTLRQASAQRKAALDAEKADEARKAAHVKVEATQEASSRPTTAMPSETALTIAYAIDRLIQAKATALADEIVEQRLTEMRSLRHLASA